MAKHDTYRTILQRVAEQITDPDDKQALSRLALVKPAEDKREPGYYANQVNEAVRHWVHGEWRGSKRYFRLIEDCLEAIKAIHEGEWRKNDSRKGVSSWVVSHRKYKYFHDKASKLEAENKLLKETIHTLTKA